MHQTYAYTFHCLKVFEILRNLSLPDIVDSDSQHTMSDASRTDIPSPSLSFPNNL